MSLLRGGGGLALAVGALCMQALPQGPGSAPSQKADVIFVHANVYTGVVANALFSSILREDAIAKAKIDEVGGRQE